MFRLELCLYLHEESFPSGDDSLTDFVVGYLYCYIMHINSGKKGTVLPFVRFTGFEKQIVETAAPAIVECISDIANIPQEIIKIELLHVEKITNSPRSVEIYMFPREEDKHHAIAEQLNSILDSYGYLHTHIFFVLLNPSLYYKEGQPLKEIPVKASPEYKL